MTNQATRQALAQDIKKEILMDLQRRNMAASRGQGMPLMGVSNMQPLDPVMVQAIKRDVMAQIEAEQEAREEMMQQNYQPYSGNQAYSSGQPFYMQTQSYPYDPALIESIKRDVLAQLEAGRNYYTDPYLVEAVKRDVLHELQVHQSKIKQ